MTAVIDEHDVTVHLGHVADVLPTLPAGSVQCCVTSPPYYGLRDYGMDGQLGLEASPAGYVAAMVAVFREVRRVLADDGVLWLNLGDSYSSSPPGKTDHALRSSTLTSSTAKRASGANAQMRESVRTAAIDRTKFLPEKNLMGIPWRVAFALQDDGWTLRNAVIWHKPNAMPESVTDRLSTRYEHVFLFSKSRRYAFDLDAVREPHVTALPVVDKGNRSRHTFTSTAVDNGTDGYGSIGYGSGGRNPGDVWTIPTSPFPAAHFACMPPELARRCILAGSREGTTILDPFAGSGTTLKVARSLGRNSVGVELNPAYIDIIRERIGQPTLDFGEATA